MKTTMTTAAALLLTLSTGDAAARKPRTVFEAEQDTLRIGTSFSVPVYDGEAEFVQHLFSTWEPYEYLDVGGSFAYSVDSDGNAEPGNLWIGVGTGLESDYKDGFAAALGADLDLGLGLYDPISEQAARMRQLGLTVSPRWFYTGSAVLFPELEGTLWLYSVYLSAAIGVPVSFPIYYAENRSVGLAIWYRASFGFGLFGDYRGGLGLNVSAYGFSNLSDDESSQAFSVYGGLHLRLGKQGLIFFMNAGGPVAYVGPTTFVITAGFSWTLDVSSKRPREVDTTVEPQEIPLTRAPDHF